MSLLNDRPDFQGSFKNEAVNLPMEQALSPVEQLSNQQRRLVQNPIGLGGQFANYSQSPIKVFTVCVDQMAVRYMAFLGSDPAKYAVGETLDSAIVALLENQKLISVARITP